MDVALFRKLFIHRDDVVAFQRQDGNGYTKIDRIITDQNIKDHFEGKNTIGVYQLKTIENTATIKWAVFDIDVNKEVWKQPDFNIDDWVEKVDEQVSLIKTELNDKGLPSYIEDSAGKGRHIWLFFDPVISAKVVRTVLQRILAKIPIVDPNLHIELFPKQDSGEYGNLVKAPLGRHMRTGKMSYFIEEVDEVEFITEKQLTEKTNVLDVIFEKCVAFRDLRNKALASGHLTHEEHLALLYVFGKMPGGIEYLTEEIFKKLKDYDEEVCNQQVKFYLKKDYSPILCASLQTPKHENICKQQCAAILPFKSPIGFYTKLEGDFKKEGNTYEKIASLRRIDGYFQIEEGSQLGYYIDPPPDKKDQRKIQISDFYYMQDEEIILDDGLEKTKYFKGKLINQNGESSFEATSEDWASDQKLAAKIYGTLGNNIFIDNITKVRDCMNKIGAAEGIKTIVKKTFGYNEDYTKYYTPSVVIDAEGVKENTELQIDLSGEDTAQFLDMKILSDVDYHHICDVIQFKLLTLLEPHVTYSAFAHAMTPIIAPFFKDIKGRYIYWMQGGSGAGKSFLMERMQCFYGTFPYVTSWSSTPNAIQKIGYFFKDAMFLVDDFKKDTVKGNYGDARRIMQTYTDMGGRSRLSSDSSLQKTYRILGWLTSTGEDNVEGEASNLARTITIFTKNKTRDMKKGYYVKEHDPMFSGFTPRYIHYILNQDKDEINAKLKYYQNLFYEGIGEQDNSMRISLNAAMLMTSFYYAANFLWGERDAKGPILVQEKFLGGLVEELIKFAVSESSSDRFWNTLMELLAAGKIRLQNDTSVDDEKTSKADIVGYYGADGVYLVMELAYAQVQKHLSGTSALGHSKNAIMNELWKAGKILDQTTSPRRFNKKPVRTVKVNPLVFAPTAD